MKQRATIALITNVIVHKKAVAVIWKSAKPRCFKPTNMDSLPVQYYHQPKAWVSVDIRKMILRKLNHRMNTQYCKIALLMDNVGCHPQCCLTDHFSNIRVIFLPPNTSKLQLLDSGILYNFKVHYHTTFLHFVLSKIDTCDTTSEKSDSVSILQAIR